MKVLHVIPAVARRYGGPSQAIFEMCRALAAQGVDVSLATTDADGPSRLPVQTSLPITYNGVETRFFASRFGERFNYSPSLASWLDQNIERFDVAHVHAVFSHPCMAAAKACRRRGVPYIIRPLGSLDPWSLRQKALLKRAIWRLSVRQMIEGAVAIHYTSSLERELAENSLSLERGVVIPLGIEPVDQTNTGDFDVFRSRRPRLDRAPYVLALSRIHPKKNYELLIEAFLSLTARHEFAQWRLVIAGDGTDAYVKSLKTLVQRNGGGEKVIFTGWLEGAEKVSATSGAALFALPSSQENFGIAVAEALAAAVPVLVSQHVNLADEIEKHESGWVTSLEPASFSKTLAQAMSDGEERRRRGNAGKRLADEKFAWPTVSADLIKLYHAVKTNGANIDEEYVGLGQRNVPAHSIDRL